MSKKFYGGLDLQTNSKLRLFESAGANFVSLRSPASLSADLDLRLPATDLANGAMVSDGSGNLSLALIVNANVSGSAAIAYSKLNLSASIVNADIASAAAIDASKIADGSVSSTEFQYINSLTSNAQTQLDGKVAKAGDTMTGNLILDNQKEVRFREASGNGTNYVGFKAPASLAGDTTYELPNAFPASSGYHLASTDAGVLSWAPANSVASFKDTWVTADTATKAIVHNLGSTDVIVQIFDVASGASIEVDSVERTDANTLTVIASEAPPATNWRVLILAV